MIPTPNSPKEGLGEHSVLNWFSLGQHWCDWEGCSVLSWSSVGSTVCLSPDGRQERVMFDKITSRIQKLCYGLNADFVDPVSATLP